MTNARELDLYIYK